MHVLCQGCEEQPRGNGLACQQTKRLRALHFQDFMRLYQAELLMEAKADGAHSALKLNEWLRGYAISAAKDKVPPLALYCLSIHASAMFRNL